MALQLVGVRLTQTELAALAELVRSGRVKTLSHALIEGAYLLLREQGIKSEAMRTIRLERMTAHTRRAKGSAPPARPRSRKESKYR